MWKLLPAKHLAAQLWPEASERESVFPWYFDPPSIPPQEQFFVAYDYSETKLPDPTPDVQDETKSLWVPVAVTMALSQAVIEAIAHAAQTAKLHDGPLWPDTAILEVW